MEFVAEVGVNHLGSEEKAISYCTKLAATEVDAVTLQIREESFYDESTSWKKSLHKDCYISCGEIIKSSGKLFGLAISDLAVAKSYINLAPDFWKVLSWGIKDLSLIEFLIATHIPVHISTGISDMAEIKSIADICDRRVGFIHTQLSSDIEDVNLSAIASMRSATGCDVSFGLHCENFDVINVAIPFAPCSIFFYVKEKPDFFYPDGSYAILLSDIDVMINSARQLAHSVGDGIKHKFVPKTLSDSDKPKSLR